MLVNANALRIPLADKSVQVICTSPPYYALRSYGIGIENGELGLEATPEEYITNLVAVGRELWRVLRDDGTFWLNLGDSYCNSNGYARSEKKWQRQGRNDAPANNRNLDSLHSTGLKTKDLMMIPARVALALQADGWYLRAEIVWCMSGGTWVYARTQKGDMPIMIRDIARLKPETVKFWNGEKWTQVLGWSKTKRTGTELEIVLRSGERISCTPIHKFPTGRGLVEASELKVGDTLLVCQLPEPDKPKDCSIDLDAAWFAGLYLAEGSRSNNCIQIAGHSKESERWDRVQRIAAKFGGSATRSVDGNKMNIRVYGRVLIAILDELVSGKTAKDKCFAPVAWRYSNAFVSEMLDGYLSGDGHYEPDDNRWRLGFTRNYNLERDLRVACARLSYRLVLNMAHASFAGKLWPSFRGEIRKKSNFHGNQKNPAEVVEVRKSRCREVYDIGIEDEPHLFSLASGILTHNSKPNPMPESVGDRPTRSHEMIYLLTKKVQYYYDAEAVKEASAKSSVERYKYPRFGENNKALDPNAGYSVSGGDYSDEEKQASGRNQRDVWNIATQSYSGAHYATFPTEIPRRAILAGTSAKGHCAKCGKGWVRIIKKSGGPPTSVKEREALEIDRKPSSFGAPVDETETGINGQRNWRPPNGAGSADITTLGWQPACKCNADVVPAIVLDPFCGSGTVGEVCRELGRRFIGLDLSIKYLRENAMPRAERSQTPESIAWLPLFGGNGDEQLPLKQDGTGNPTYTGFNTRWKETHSD